MIRQTSLSAYRILENCGDLGYRQIKVLRVLKRGNYTDFELSNILCWPINQITGRRNELVKAGYIEEKARKNNPLTKRKAIVWGIK